jgi:hypothetical protein
MNRFKTKDTGIEDSTIVDLILFAILSILVMVTLFTLRNF